MRKQTGILRAVPVALFAVTVLVLTAWGGSENVCGPTAPVDPIGVTGAIRKIKHAAGETEVPADPQRIVVLDTDKLDTVCALGLQGRLVGAAVTGAVGTQPKYLGATIARVEAVGTLKEVDFERIAALRPDLILGSMFRTPDAYERLSTIAPTAFTEKVGKTWKDNLVLDGTALGRGASAREVLASYESAATETGKSLNSSQTQVSVVRFIRGTIRVYGPDSFSGQVLADVGVQRPTFQRLEDAEHRRFAEISEQELSKADGDVVYVSFYGDEARRQGIDVMNRGLWQALGAAKDKRVFTVNDEIWMTGIGVVAANSILDDLEASLDKASLNKASLNRYVN